MARRGRGVVLNIASDLSVVAPDQRLYRKANTPDDEHPAKSVTYSVIKTGLIGYALLRGVFGGSRRSRRRTSPGGSRTVSRMNS